MRPELVHSYHKRQKDWTEPAKTAVFGLRTGLNRFFENYESVDVLT